MKDYKFRKNCRGKDSCFSLFLQMMNENLIVLCF